jgi:hypothetical protein
MENPKAPNTTTKKTKGKPAPVKVDFVKGESVVVNKNDMDWTDEERKRIESNLLNSQKKQEVVLIRGEEGTTRDVKSPEVKETSTLFFKACKDGNYSIDGSSTKVLIESCSNCTFHFNGQIKTEMLELWRCDNITINSNTSMKTLQADMTNTLNLAFKNKDHFQNVIWGGVHDLSLTIGEGDAMKSTKTGFKEMQEKHADQTLNMEIDQFYTRIVNDELLTEQLVRLKNGYPTTEREAKEFDDKQKANEEAREKYIRDLVKFAAPRLGLKDDRKRPKGFGRNDACPCKSGRKFKKCCWDKYEN